MIIYLIRHFHLDSVEQMRRLLFSWPQYEDCLSNFGIKEQKKTLFNENQNILHEELYTFECIWTDCPNFFATQVEVSKCKIASSVPNQDQTEDDTYVLVTQKCSCSNWCVRAFIVVICLGWLVLLISWKTTGKQMVV